MTSPRALWFVERLDRNRYAFFAVLVMGGLFLLGDGVTIMRSAQLVAPELGAVPGQLTPRPVPVLETVTWWDYGRTAVTFFALAALAVMMLRSRAVSIFKEEIDAQRVRVERLQREHEETLKAAALKDAEIATLRSRTDLTEVVKMQQDLLLMKKEHDTAIVAAIAQIGVRGDQQYKDAMETLGKTLNYLADAARAEQVSMQANRALLDRLLKLAESNWHATSRIEQAVTDRDSDADPRG